MFSELQSRFTQYSLSEFLEIDGSHAKTLYRILKQWKYKGTTPLITIEKFKFLFGLNEKYKLGDIDRWVINPSIEELAQYFQNLEVHKKYENRKSKGRPKLEGYWFSFKAEQQEKTQVVQPTQESISKVTSWKKTNRYCPRCHRAIYKKHLENENGTYYLYGHTDFKTGDCSYTTYDFADLLEKYQLPNDTSLTEKQQESKRKFSDIISSIFK